METDKAADTDTELSISTESSEYCSEPDSDDNRIQPPTGIDMNENVSPRSLSREESVVSGIPGPTLTEKVVCSTLIETPDKTAASVPTKYSQSQNMQKDRSTEILIKLDKILENQVAILSQLQIRTERDAVDAVNLDEITRRQSPPLPQLTPTPAKQINNVNPVVNDAMLAETLRLKPKSSSAGNLATKLVKVIFKPEELINKNCSGSRGKEKLDEEKLKKLINYVCKGYGVLTENQRKMTGGDCRLAIDELLRRGN